MDPLRDCNGLYQFNDFLKTVEPVLGKRGGRYFKAGQHSYSMNEVILKLDRLAKKQNDLTILPSCIEKIKLLDKAQVFATLKNKEVTLKKILTLIKQAVGNTLFNLTHKDKTAILKDLESLPVKKIDSKEDQKETLSNLQFYKKELDSWERINPASPLRFALNKDGTLGAYHQGVLSESNAGCIYVEFVPAERVKQKSSSYPEVNEMQGKFLAVFTMKKNAVNEQTLENDPRIIELKRKIESRQKSLSFQDPNQLDLQKNAIKELEEMLKAREFELGFTFSAIDNQSSTKEQREALKELLQTLDVEMEGLKLDDSDKIDCNAIFARSLRVSQKQSHTDSPFPKGKSSTTHTLSRGNQEELQAKPERELTLLTDSRKMDRKEGNLYFYEQELMEWAKEGNSPFPKFYLSKVGRLGCYSEEALAEEGTGRIYMGFVSAEMTKVKGTPYPISTGVDGKFLAVFTRRKIPDNDPMMQKAKKYLENSSNQEDKDQWASFIESRKNAFEFCPIDLLNLTEDQTTALHELIQGLDQKIEALNLNAFEMKSCNALLARSLGVKIREE